MSFNDDEIAVKVTDVNKAYQIYEKPADRLLQGVMPRVRRAFGLKEKKYFREFRTLKDINFEVRKGGTVGIIGRNGAGKSTLLQIICGTLAPTQGGVEVNGRVAALLELGAGFNPEFSGRENVYMNASILGLSTEEINERYSSILEFADIGEYIDQPVKTYSSGMYVRLAFAVVAHVDADILIIDEALSVGDAVFTQKCMRFIRKFQKNGTLLFVSHDMASVQNLCESAIWLNESKVCLSGPAKDVAEEYLQYTLQEAYGDDAELAQVVQNVSIECESQVEGADTGGEYSENTVYCDDNVAGAKGWKTGGAEILTVALKKNDGNSAAALKGGEDVCLEIRARANCNMNQPILGFIVKDRLGQDLFGENTLQFTNQNSRCVSMGQSFFGRFRFKLPMLPNGEYSVMVSVAEGDQYNNIQHHYLHDALIIKVLSSVVRWGLVGIPFQEVSLGVCDE